MSACLANAAAFGWLRGELWPYGLLALVVAFAALAGGGSRARSLAFVHPARRAALALHWRSWAPGWRAGAATLAALALFAALLGPARGYGERPVLQRGVDLVVAIDTSRSMLARDVRPDRLTRAKREVQGLIDRLGGDRVALLAFAGDVRQVSPLTHDRTALGFLLARIDPRDNRRGGTDLGAALERALELFDGRTGNHEAIVLVTDGEDLEGRGAKVAAQAAERGIRVFVVGVGTELGGKIPVLAGDGRETFLVGPDGEEVVTRLDGETLVRLARASGGEYLSVEDSATPLEELYLRRIARLDTRAVEGGAERVPLDRYQWPLVLALLLLLVDVGLCERRRRRAEVRP